MGFPLPNSSRFWILVLMKKFIFRGLLVIVGLLVVGLTILYFTINTMIASEIETAATDALGVDTTVDSFEISLFEERTTISGLDIANPKGYDGEFLTLKRGVLGVDLGSVFSERIEIKLITLRDIELNLIQRLNGSNVGTIIDHASGSPSDNDSKSTDDGSDPQKFIIDKVLVKNVQVTFSLEPVTSERQPTKLTIDQILVRDIGRKENGVPLDQVTTIILHSIIASAAKAAPMQVPSLLLTTMEGGLSSLGHLDLGGVQFDLGKGMADVVGKITKVKDGGEDAIKNAVDEIGKGLGKVIGTDSETSNGKKK